MLLGSNITTLKSLTLPKYLITSPFKGLKILFFSIYIESVGSIVDASFAISSLLNSFFINPNVAHSGTVVGILIDKSMNDTRLIELLKNERLDSVYKKMYTSNIIDGGIRGEQTWNTSKIL